MPSYNLRSQTRGNTNSADRSDTLDFPGTYTPAQRSHSPTPSFDAEEGLNLPPPAQPIRLVEFPPINDHAQGQGEAPIILSSPTTNKTYSSILDETPIRANRVRSHSEGSPRVRAVITPLTKEQVNTIKIAQSSLTRPQREAIAERRRRIEKAYHDYDKRKGKQVDPREWGAVNIPDNELNVEAQAQELDKLREAQEARNAAASKNKPVHKSGQGAHVPEDPSAEDRRRHRSATAPLSHEVENFIHQLPGGHKKRDRERAHKSHKDYNSKAAKPTKDNHTLLPSAHLDKKSYLGHALALKPKNGRKNKYISSSSSSEDDTSGDESSDPQDSDSESDESPSDGDDSSSNSSSDSSTDSESDTSSTSSSDSSDTGRRKGRSRKRKSKRSKKSRKNKKRSYLKPIAPEPYDGTPDPRRFHRFATLVTAYLEDGNVPRNRQALYFTTIGYTDKRERVNRLWHGFKPSIQKALWKDKLHPDTSKWNEVVRAAEINEIADSVMVNAGPERKADKHDRNHNEHRHRKDKRRHHDRKRRDSPNGRKTNTTPNFSSVKHKFQKWDNKKKLDRPKRKELSKEEMDELRAANKCFNCRDIGHQARHCPKKNSLPRPEQGSSSGHHTRNYNIEFDIKETERLRDLVDHEETLNVFGANMIGFDIIFTDDEVEPELQCDSIRIDDISEDEGCFKPFDDEFVDYREYIDPKDFLIYQDDPRFGPYMDDPLVAKAVAQLSHCRFYPGDEMYKSIRDSIVLRFKVFCSNEDGTMYSIFDELHDSVACISKRRLEDPDFNLTHWYWNYCAHAHGMAERDPEFPVQTIYIGDPYAFRAEQILASNRTYYPGELRSERRNHDDLTQFLVIPHEPEV
ncbi:hypothetical protein CVT24_006990, partial [Panaeolus cyanescens]